MKLDDAPAQSSAISGRRLGFIYVATWLTSLATTLLTIGIYFYTAHEFGWGALQNMSLASGQGAAYACGALLSQHVRAHFGVRRSLLVLYVVLGALGAAIRIVPTHWGAAAILLLYAFVAAVNWPMLESLLTAGTGARQMSRRVGTYNVVWASASAAAVASAGWMIGHRPAALFVVAIASHVMGALRIAWAEKNARSMHDSVAATPASPLLGRGDAGVAATGQLAEPELLHVRTLALWLSRIALPASYVVNYGLSALLPSLLVLRSMGPTGQSICGSVWLASRWIGFLLLTHSVFWHTRPRLLLGSAAVMLVAFVGVSIPLSDIATLHGAISLDLPAMLFAQVVLGLAMAMIYSGSLYFGMVLSDGSTEHGGYHEALIGLGCVLGPGAGAMTQWLWPGDVRRAVLAVASVVGITVIGAAVASLLIRRKRL